MIATLLSLAATLGPKLYELATSDDKSTAEKAIGAISQTAQAITGTSSDEEAASALSTNPEFQLQFAAQANQHAIDLLDRQIANLKEVNETSRQETKSEDPFVRRARPALIWVVVFCLAIMALSIPTAFFVASISLTDLADVFNAFSVPIGIALTACGIYIKQRSNDKQVAKGMEPKGLLGMFK